MASTGSWSVVGKGKKVKGSGQNLSKSQKKQLAEKMQRVELVEAANESSTIYDALVAKERQREQQQQQKFVDKIESGKKSPGRGLDGSGRRQTTVKKKKPEHEKKRSLEDAMKHVTEEELKSVFLQSKGVFPERSEVWLKDLVTYLNTKLDMVPPTDKYLKPENRGYPLSAMDSGCVKVFNSVISDCNVPTLEHILYFCIQTMLDEDQNGLSTYGYKIFLQLLAKAKPELVLSRIGMFKEMIKTSQNRPQRCLSILWSLGQVGLTDLRSGVRVWLDLMLPYLGVMKSISPYCVEYIQSLLSCHSKKRKTASGEIKLREYFYLLDLIFGQSLQPDLKKKMMSVYPQLKTMAYGDNVNSNLRNFFPSYLVRAKSDCTPALKSEVMSCLVLCLVQDKQSYGLWCQHYTKHLSESSVLMQHMLDRWDKVSRQLDRKMLHQTVKSFLRTNEDMLEKGKQVGDLTTATAVSEELLKKMSGSKFPWRWLAFFLVSTVIGIVVYDVYSSKSFRASRTVSFLEMYGVLGFLEQGWNKICLYSGIIYSWLQVNVPHYCGLVYDTVTPYILQAIDFIRHIEENTREHRKLVLDRIYALAPDFWNQVGVYIQLSLDFILEYSYWIWRHICVLWQEVYHWIEETIVKGDFSTESVKETLTWSVSRLQHFTHAAVGWCKQIWT